MRMRTYGTGLDKNATGYDDAIIRQIKDAIMVVMTAPNNPVLKKFSKLSLTPNMFVPVSRSTLIAVIRAKISMQHVTSICRPTRKAGKFFGSANTNWQTLWAIGWSCSRSVRRMTANNAICIPSNIPTTIIRTKKKMMRWMDDISSGCFTSCRWPITNYATIFGA